MTSADRPDINELTERIRHCRHVVALTGAGLSTASGIPDYRDEDGGWKRPAPVQYLDFVRHPATRRRYWSRSLLGWPVMERARPNSAHRAVARLESGGIVSHVITQNVDGLHQHAGSQRVIDLHGRIDAVACLGCERSVSRGELQDRLIELNPDWADLEAPIAPDGDADLERDASQFLVPDCEACGGTLKPDVVFFGESVPRLRVEDAYARVADAGALLVAGTSLMVFSGYRFVRAAVKQDIPVWIVNRGRTRADADAALRVEADCGWALSRLASSLDV